MSGQHKETGNGLLAERGRPVPQQLGSAGGDVTVPELFGVPVVFVERHDVHATVGASQPGSGLRRNQPLPACKT